MKKMRLDAFITSQSDMSRRQVMALLKSGDITVNGVVAQSGGQEIFPTKDTVMVSKKRLRLQDRFLYYKFYKPSNVISTLSDPKGRPCLKGFMDDMPAGLKPVGRLDRQTTGLLLFTNDGQFSNRIMHPSFELKKTYRVRLDKPISVADQRHLVAGLFLEDGPVTFDRLEMVSDASLDVTLHEGRNRIVRRSFAALGYEVTGLKRLSIANITLGTLKKGQWAALSSRDVKALSS